MMKMLQKVSKEYIARTRKLFHCHCKIKLPVCYGESLIDQCFEIFEKIDMKYNSYQSGSYFNSINYEAGNRVKVDDKCIHLLQTLQLVSRLTQGSFDITCMPLLRLWGFYRQANQDIPSLDELRKTLAKVNYRSVLIDGNDVSINPGQEIVTGAFIKAFAVDKGVEFLKEQGVTDAIINAGGSTIMALNDETHPYWNINIPDAFVKGQYSSSIAISNQCFSLSGRLNSNLVIKGKTYGHILNSRTGLPAQTAQVGIITQKAFLGDVLSTALFTVNKNEAGEIIEKIKEHFDFNYFRIEENGKQTSDICF